MPCLRASRGMFDARFAMAGRAGTAGGMRWWNGKERLMDKGKPRNLHLDAFSIECPVYGPAMPFSIRRWRRGARSFAEMFMAQLSWSEPENRDQPS